MRALDIRAKELPEFTQQWALEVSKVEILQELTAQLADLNETIAGLGVVADRVEDILNRIAFAVEGMGARSRG